MKEEVLGEIVGNVIVVGIAFRAVPELSWAEILLIIVVDTGVGICTRNLL